MPFFGFMLDFIKFFTCRGGKEDGVWDIEATVRTTRDLKLQGSGMERIDSTSASQKEY